MLHVITCVTLFDVTYTGIPIRNKVPENHDPNLWVYKRNTQSNFDTILQAISLRSQPDVIKKPVKKHFKFDETDYFGFFYQQTADELYSYWEFDFTVQHQNVFNDGITEFGALYNDCHKIPMLKCGNECIQLGNFLDCTPEFQNIYFTIR